MKWNNTITSFNLEGKKVIREDNVLVCICTTKEIADYIVLLHNKIQKNEN